MSELVPLAEIRYVDLPNGEHIAYREFNPAGSRTLVLVHGNLTNHLIWRGLISHPKMQDHRLIALDCRGFGWSSYKRSATSHVEYGGDLGHFAQQLGLTQVNFMGWSTLDIDHISPLPRS